MISEKIRTGQRLERARGATGNPLIVGTDRESSLTSRETQPMNPEIPEKATRRRFTAECKMCILRQAEACRGAGDIGVLLRREGLYFFHLTTWRRQRDAGILSGLKPQRWSPKPMVRIPCKVKSTGCVRRPGDCKSV
jgi:hypothetical protein